MTTPHTPTFHMGSSGEGAGQVVSSGRLVPVPAPDLRSVLAGHLRGSAVDALLDELGPEMVERLEVGLLLAEVERRARDGILNVSQDRRIGDTTWYAVITNGGWSDFGYPFTAGPTLHAALVALLA